MPETKTLAGVVTFDNRPNTLEIGEVSTGTS